MTAIGKGFKFGTRVQEKYCLAGTRPRQGTVIYYHQGNSESNGYVTVAWDNGNVGYEVCETLGSFSERELVLKVGQVECSQVFFGRRVASMVPHAGGIIMLVGPGTENKDSGYVVIDRDGFAILESEMKKAFAAARLPEGSDE